jgi:His/Glu/Gln/Arg/opine family amino acid ABC transporter permease subunit
MNFFSWAFFCKTFIRLLGRIPVTLGITVGAFTAGFALSLVLAAVLVYKPPVAYPLARLYISFMRGTPLLIQLLICNIALPSIIWGITGYNVGRYWPPIVFVITAYALNNAAFLAEILRASVLGVGAGQQEAAFSVGLTELQSLRYILLPQAFRIGLPGIATNLSSLLKDTSLAYSAAGILDVMGMVTVNGMSIFRDGGGATFRELEGYVGAAVIFFALCLLLERAMHLLSARLSVGTAVIKREG